MIDFPSAPHYAAFETVFESFTYPAGESHVRLRKEFDPSCLETIEAHARGFSDLAQIVTADRILRRHNLSVRWFVPYFPFARHDRRNDACDGFELQLALELVADLDLVIADPHSEVAAQLPHFGQVDSVSMFREAGLFDGNPIVVIPDAGAAKKAWDWIAGEDVLQAQKHRDPATGKLSGFSVPTLDLEGRACIIVDDICDGGGTFLGLATELEKVNAGLLTLAVTHGVFTKGLNELRERFATVACMTPLLSESQTDTTAISFNDLYARGTIV